MPKPFDPTITQAFVAHRGSPAKTHLGLYNICNIMHSDREWLSAGEMECFE